MEEYYYLMILSPHGIALKIEQACDSMCWEREWLGDNKIMFLLYGFYYFHLGTAET